MQNLIQDSVLIFVVCLLVRILHDRLSVYSVVYAATIGVHMLTRPELAHDSLRVDNVLRVMMRSVVTMLLVVSFSCIVLAV